MREDGTAKPEATGLERSAAAFCMAAFATVTVSVVTSSGGWLEELGVILLLFLGLELAAAAVTVAAVALAIGPHRGDAARPAWLAAGASLALVLVAVVWLLPHLLVAPPT